MTTLCLSHAYWKSFKTVKWYANLRKMKFEKEKMHEQDDNNLNCLGIVQTFVQRLRNISHAKADSQKHRNKNIEKVREYDRQRAKTDSRIKQSIEITRRWRNDDKRRARAHSAVAWAIKSGDLVRAPCESCGREDVHAHHDDYDKPLEVRWLCPACHAQHHKQGNP